MKRRDLVSHESSEDHGRCVCAFGDTLQDANAMVASTSQEEAVLT